MKKLLLIDASNLLFRSYYATAYAGNLMQNKKGMYTNGIYGFAHAMNRLISDGYTHFLVALDPIGKTHRHDIYAEYKGKRKATPQELKMQFPLMEKYLDALGVYYYRQEKYEADDIIGVLAWYATTILKEPTVMVSNDKDFIQCHSEYVCQYRPIEEGFVRHLEPQKFLKELIIRGDSDDGVPNIKSPDNIFTIKGSRQKSIFQKDLDIWLNDDDCLFLNELDVKFEELYEKELKKDKNAVKIVPSTNFYRNEQLIDLSSTPDEIVNNIIAKFEENTQKVNKPKMIKFFMKHRLRYLHERINDFM